MGVTFSGLANLPVAMNTPKEISIKDDFLSFNVLGFRGSSNWDFSVQKLLENTLVFAHIFVGLPLYIFQHIFEFFY